MSRIYSLEEKEQAMALLREKSGDVPLVSYLTGISERTLYAWRKQLRYAMHEEEITQPRHWVRQQPERQERLQQQRENSQRQQQQQHHMTAFGMTHAELEEALKLEFIVSEYTNLRADLMLHLQHINFSLTDDPETAHRKALAFNRMLEAVLKLEELVRIQKPQVNIIKYEYPDGTYHDVPYWSNEVYARADAAYEAVLAEAKRQYEEQQAALNPQPVPDYEREFLTPDMEEMLKRPSAEEIIAKPFTPEDFIPKYTGYHKYFLGEDPYAHLRGEDTANPPSSSEGNSANPNDV